MKTLLVDKNAHHSVKVEAAKAGITTVEMTIHLIREGVALLNKGKMASPKKGGKS